MAKSPTPAMTSRRLTGGVIMLALVFAGLPTAPVSAYSSPSVELEGHGWGHGQGLGAWGAYGMAVRTPGMWGEDIAKYYYTGTRIGQAPNDQIRSWLDYDTPFVDTVVGAGGPATAPDRVETQFTIWALHSGGEYQLATSDGTWSFWRVRAEGTSLRLQRATDAWGSPGGWEAPEQQGGLVPGDQRIEFRPPPGPQDGSTKLLQVFTGGETWTWRYFRGSIRTALVSNQVYTISVLPIQEYLYGVMRIEGSPSWWDSAGREGLRALTIAARSYALNRRSSAMSRGAAYDLCSSSNCQNYKGWGYVGTTSGATVQLEDSRTNAAVDTTAVEVLYYGSDPVPILGAYSSSSGGYSKPGSLPYLQAVPDPHDDISNNRNHRWFESVPVSKIESKWPALGQLIDFQITERNGYGDWGGRVVTVRMTGSKSTINESGTSVRSKLDLKSDWFKLRPEWESLGGVLKSGPDAASWGPGRLDVFLRASDDSLYHRGSSGGAWYPWEGLGGTITSGPSAVSWDYNRIDIFARGTDGGLWHMSWNNGWSQWDGLGGDLAEGSGPDAASRAPGLLDVFIRGLDDALWTRSWNGTGWTPWRSLGGVLASDPTAVSWSKDRVDVFAKGADGALWHILAQGNTWSGWERVGGRLISGPDASSWGEGRLDIFAVGLDNALWQVAWTGSGWSPWQSLGGVVSADPGAVSSERNRIDVFVRGSDNGLWRKIWDGFTWHG